MVNSVTAKPLLPDPKKLELIASAFERDMSFLYEQNAAKRIMKSIGRSFSKFYYVAPPFWRVANRVRENSVRMRPSFFSTGAVRSGTTSLSEYILQHPSVVLPMAKEIGFAGYRSDFVFAQLPTEKQARETEKKYGKAITGICNPLLPRLSIPYVYKGIAPEAKVVVILRDPVQRTHAHWRSDRPMLASSLSDPILSYMPGFEQLIEAEIQAIKGYGCSSTFQNFGYGSGSGYVQQSVYLPFLKVLFSLYQRENILVVNANEFFKHTASVVKKVYQHLGLPDYDPVIAPARHPGPREQMSETAKTTLKKFFEPLNQELYEFLGQDFAW